MHNMIALPRKPMEERSCEKCGGKVEVPASTVGKVWHDECLPPSPTIA